MRISSDTRKSAKFADDLITTDAHSWCKVVEDLGNDHFKCIKIVTAKMSTRKLGLPLPWDLIGVKR